MKKMKLNIPVLMVTATMMILSLFVAKIIINAVAVLFGLGFWQTLFILSAILLLFTLQDCKKDEIRECPKEDCK